MTRPVKAWIAFGVCVLVVIAAMATGTALALVYEASQYRSDRLARHEGRVQLALWRIDATLMPLVAEQSARPYSLYALPAGRAPSRRNIRSAMAAVPDVSRLPDGKTFVLCHFAILPDGRIASQRPGIASATAPTAPPQWLTDPAQRTVLQDKLNAAPLYGVSGLARIVKAAESARGGSDFGQRQQAFNRAATANQMQQVIANNDEALGGNPYAGARETRATVVWVGEALVVARRVVFGDKQYVLGSQLNWPAIETWITRDVAELLGRVDFRRTHLPAESLQRGNDRGMLAAVPLAMNPQGGLPPAPRTRTTLVGLLAVAWAALLAAATAVGVTLQRTMALSERRAQFVSAVTHELRTPLTSLQMYTDMLADGMGRPESAGEYLRTIRAETSRLGRLVENVLIWSRLDRRADGLQRSTVTTADMLRQIAQRLRERTDQAEMELVCETGDVGESSVTTDPAAVEQILFNLVDNACKYASRCQDKRIHLSAACDGSQLRLSVRDHGPGIPPGEVGRVFQPFSRAQRDTAGTHGGVGLGLDICRRLTERLGGTLSLQDTDDGACFVIALSLT